MDRTVQPSSGFILGDGLIPTGNVILVVYQSDIENLAVWMPRHASDCLTPEIARGLVEMVSDFVMNVPRRQA